jgi:hypothetical protein
MTLPGYTAGASLYTTSRSYRGGRCGTAVDEGLTVVPQHDPCAMGGVVDLPTACPHGQRCCGVTTIVDGRPHCDGRCTPFNLRCNDGL